MALPAVIQRLQTDTYTITRNATPTNVQGRLVPGAQSFFDIIAVIQPFSQRDRYTYQTALDGVAHNEEPRIVYSEERLIAISPTNSSDQVTIDGELWSVFHSERWDYRGDTYFKTFITRDEKL